jgi:hypothetical protein
MGEAGHALADDALVRDGEAAAQDRSIVAGLRERRSDPG